MFCLKCLNCVCLQYGLKLFANFVVARHVGLLTCPIHIYGHHGEVSSAHLLLVLKPHMGKYLNGKKPNLLNSVVHYISMHVG